ncbi:MAG TPA: GntR family transcriptional regulator [Sphingomicrobium sp.]|nr:GntR family transcriptional regulator [Sphingomicrobium sp.]
MSDITPSIVAEAVRADIANGRVPPGFALRQEELAQRFGVSRIPVREALRQLEAEGIVTVRANRGAFVRSFSPEELREIFDLRIMLETDLLRRAVPAMTQDDFEHIEAALDGVAPARRGNWRRELDRRFHQALYQPAGRPLQLEMAMKLRDSIAHYAPAEDHMRRLTSDWMDDHREIATACAQRRSDEAVRLLRHHLEVAAELTLGTLDRDPARQRAVTGLPSIRRPIGLSPAGGPSAERKP